MDQATLHTEIERTYEVDESAVMPSLVGTGCAVSESSREITLVADYHDTARLELLQHGVTLRRRTGGDDAGWHLKLPGGTDTRTEVRAPLGPEGSPVPPELLEVVRAVIRTRAVRPVARIENHRTETDLLDEGGAVLAQTCDDRVTASRLGTRGQHVSSTSWREWELEVGASDDPQGLLDSLEPLLLDAGAVLSSSPSKLARTFGDSRPAPARTVTPAKPKEPTAGEALRAHLAEHVDTLVAQDRRVREDADDSVHKMRVAARRLRSALKTYRDLLDPDAQAPGYIDIAQLEADLRWIGQVLGVARDAEVQRDHFATEVAQLPPELVLGPVAARIQSDFGREYAQGLRDSVAAMSGRRYLRMLDTLDRLVSEPALLPVADKPASKVLPTLLEADARRIRKAHKRAMAADGEHRDEGLHEVRKKAKRLRYAAESATPVLGSSAKDLAKAAEAVQEVLGEHQDSVVSRARLRELAVTAQGAGESAFTYGVLHGLETRRGERLEEDLAGVWKDLRKVMP